jgi:hypothetical protein
LRVRGRSQWKRWVLALAAVGLLAMAPLLAHAQGDSVVVAWTAPGDDLRAGTAREYDLRISGSPISDQNFSNAQRLDGLPVPGAAGVREHFTVRGLERGTTYYLALRTADDAGNWSGISNVVRWDWTIDTAPPSTPTNLSAEKEGGSVLLSWSANAEADLDGYMLYRATSAAGPWTALNTTPLEAPEFTDANPPTGAATAWYQVSARDATGNESARSSSVSVTLAAAPRSTTEWTIEPGYPNPSRASTPVQIPVVVPESSDGRIVVDVLDAGGRLIRRIERWAGTGIQEVQWDGKNDAGREVAPGVYRAWLTSGSTKRSIRLLRVP